MTRFTPIFASSAVVLWAAAYFLGPVMLVPAVIATAMASIGYVLGRRPADAPHTAIAGETGDAQDCAASVDEAPAGPLMPDSLDPASVVRAVAQDAQSFGDALGVHLWVHDDGSGSLRLVASSAPPGPGSSPLIATADPTVQSALAQGAAVLEAVSRMTGPAGASTTVWRYAVPVDFGEMRGVAALDFAGREPPDSAALNRFAATWRLPLVCALALHLSESRNKATRDLLDVVRELSRTLDPQRVLQAALDRAVKLAEAATGSVMLLDEGTGRMSISAAVGLPQEVVRGTSVGSGEGIAGWVAASGQPLLVEDLPGKAGRGQRHGVRSAISVPIADEEGLLGVLNVGSRAYPAAFTDAHMSALEILGRQTAVALRNARAVVASNSLYLDTLKALVLALETKDPYASGGTERVVDLALALGRTLRLDPAQLRALELAALLHDMGMSAVVDAGTSSPGPLSTVEQGLLKMHPVIAAEILDKAPALRAVTPIVYHHHEHFDGGGYAAGAAGDEIPIGARILSVADAFVAMTSDRPYRRAMSAEQALAETLEKSGTQFDPVVVEALRDLIRTDPNRVPEHGA